MQLAYAQIKNPAHEGMNLPQRFNVYKIKINGEVVGEIKHVYRPKNAGGSAWGAYYDPKAVGSNQYGPGATMVVYEKTFNGLLAELRKRWTPVAA